MRRRALIGLLAVCIRGGLADGQDLQVAREALADGLHALVRQRAAAVLTQDDATPEARREAFVLWLQSLDQTGEIDALRARLETLPAALQAESQALWLDYWRARLAYRAGEYELALKRAGEVAARAGEDFGLRLRAGRIEALALTALERPDEALALYARLEPEADAPPEWRAINLDWAELLYRTGADAECEARLAPGASGDPSDPVAAREWMLRVAALERLERMEEAMTILRRLVESQAPETVRGEAALHLSRLLQDSARLDEAMAAARQAETLLRATPLASHVTLRLGLLLAARESHRDEGLVLLRSLARAEPRGPYSETAQLALADTLRAVGEAENAAAAYQVFLESFAGSEHEMRALWGRAWALLALDRFVEAAATFQKAHDLAPDGVWRVQTQTKMADAWFAAGRLEAAAAAYRDVFDSDPDPEGAARAGVQEAEALLRIQRIADAEMALSRVHARFPDLAEGIEAGLRLGRVRAERGAAAEAVAVFSAIADRHPDPEISSRAWLGRGRVYYRTFQFEKALDDFERVRELDTDVAAEAAFLRAMSFYWLGRDSEALTALTVFFERYPQSPLRRDAVFWQGRYAYNRQHYERARERFEHFAATWPDHEWADDALLWAARAAFADDAYSDALTISSRLVDRFPNSPNIPDIRFLQGESLAMQADFEQAILAFNEILTRYPDSDWVTAAWGRKGDCLFTLGMEDPARYEESVHAYRVVTQRPDAPMDVILQAAFKGGRSLEKLARFDEALATYYTEVILRFQEAVEQGVWHNEASQAWFARAAFQSADLLEARRQWDAAIRVLRRLVESGVQGNEEALERIRRIEREQRWGFPVSSLTGF